MTEHSQRRCHINNPRRRKSASARPYTNTFETPYFGRHYRGEEKLVGIQCKSCGHRVLIMRELSPSEPFMMDHEIIAKLRQSAPPTCSQCGVSNIIHVSMTSNLVDDWLNAGPPSRSPGPLIEGDNG